MAITTFKRYEMKFMLDQAQLDTLIPLLLEYMVPDAHCQEGKEYNIYNIYYDTHDSNLIRHSLSKPYYKEKLRLRSYTIPTSFNDQVFLELKKKIGGIVNKRRVVLTLKDAYDFVRLGKCPVSSPKLNKQVASEIEYFLSRNQVSPAAYISYKRLAYFGKDDKDFRVTFDYNVCSRRDDLFLELPSYGTPLLEKGQYLMEVKLSGAVPIWLSRTLSGLRLYKTNFSKYGKEYENYCTLVNPSLCANY
ncbi:polyphosphate polymerase domain-containing protein [Desulfosporosinus meridiei]|uniref:VTC domain-containing protein n=1 Tax=Desulfosporosinus meridiei (strain ATCC BAA-275 / DSM 13257 / KCTC 12902 / NCIMB 13706 / S10) TaxID=768704 RepID=J7IKD2_DESMD|nr:polyphosphate polymerase domain-containing protein [Desulfosporosinus meridiei]AFQ42227.1 VTC domain-containing protein [Desulfosporosinus meridiei DSM 13257]